MRVVSSTAGAPNWNAPPAPPCTRREGLWRFPPRWLLPGLGALALLAASWLSESQASEPLELSAPVVALSPALDRENAWWLGGGREVRLLSLRGPGRQSLGQQQFEDVKVNEVIGLGHDEFLLAGTDAVSYGYLARWRLGDPQPRRQADDLPVPVTSLSQASGLVVAGDDQGVMRAFAADDGQLLWQATLHSKLITDLVDLGEGRCASSDWGGKIVVFDARSGQVVLDFQQHRDHVVSLVAESNAQPPRLYSASRDGTIRLWYPSQRRLVRFVQLPLPATSLASLGDGLVVAATNDARLHLIDMERAEVVRSCDSEVEYVAALAAATREELLISTGRDRVLLSRQLDLER